MAVDLLRILLNIFFCFWCLVYGLSTLHIYKKKKKKEKEKATLYLAGMFLTFFLAYFFWIIYGTIVLIEGERTATGSFFIALSQMVGIIAGLFAFLFGIEFGSKIKDIDPKIKKIGIILFIISEILFIPYLFGVDLFRLIANLIAFLVFLYFFAIPAWLLLKLNKATLERKTEINLFSFGYIIWLIGIFLLFIGNMGEIIILIFFGTITSIVSLSLFFLGIYYPISDRIEAQKRLKKSDKRYREAYNRAEIYKDIFIHDISNILQNILLTIDLNLDYEIKPDSGNERIMNLNMMKSQVLNGTLLISNVRRLSQIEDEPLNLESMNITALLDDSINFLKNNYSNKNINITIEHEIKNLQVFANNLLLDVFKNILINSVKHNKNNIIEIEVKTTEIQKDEKKYVKIEFIDNGIGIEDLRKEEIFQREISQERSLSGLGLLFVNKIIEAYRGQVWVKNKVKNDYTKGSNFVLLIPAT